MDIYADRRCYTNATQLLVHVHCIIGPSPSQLSSSGIWTDIQTSVKCEEIITYYAYSRL